MLALTLQGPRCTCITDELMSEGCTNVLVPGVMIYVSVDLPVVPGAVKVMRQ